MSRTPHPPQERPVTAPTAGRRASDALSASQAPAPAYELRCYDDIVSKWQELYSKAKESQNAVDESKPFELQEKEAACYAKRLVEYACQIAGVDILSIRRQRIYPCLLPGKEESRKEAALHVSKSDQRSRIEDAAGPVDDDEQNAINSAIAEERKRGNCAEDIAFQRVRQHQSFLHRTLSKIDNKCHVLVFEEKSFAFSDGRAKSRSIRSTAVLEGISSRMGREKSNFTKRVLAVVNDMREVVQKRKHEIEEHLRRQNEENDERVQYYQNLEREKRRRHREQCADTQRKWKADAQNRKRLREEKKASDHMKAELTQHLEAITYEGALRKEEETTGRLMP